MAEDESDELGGSATPLIGQIHKVNKDLVSTIFL